MNRKVIYARLHQGAYAPGAGELGSVFPPQSKTLENLNLTAVDQGLIIDFTYRGIKQELLVPSANIVIMSLAPEEKPALKAVKSA